MTWEKKKKKSSDFISHNRFNNIPIPSSAAVNGNKPRTKFLRDQLANNADTASLSFSVVEVASDFPFTPRGRRYASSIRFTGIMTRNVYGTMNIVSTAAATQRLAVCFAPPPRSLERNNMRGQQ